MKILNMELKRMYRSHISQLSVILLILIGVLGIVLYNIYYGSRSDSRYILFSLYNSYTQFTYLVLAFVFVSTFCKDFQKGVYAWYKQLGYSFERVCIMKFLSLSLIVLPLINIAFIVGQIASKNDDYGYFILCMLCVNFNVIYIMVLSLFVSVVFRKVIQATLVMYGMYVLFNGMNLVLYGVINPTDSNSISSYYLGFLLEASQTHYSLSKVMLSESTLCFLSLMLPLVWSTMLLIVTMIIKKYRKV